MANARLDNSHVKYSRRNGAKCEVRYQIGHPKGVVTHTPNTKLGIVIK